MAEQVINPKGQYLYIWATQDATKNPIYSWYKTAPRQRVILPDGTSWDLMIDPFSVTLTGKKTYAWAEVHYLGQDGAKLTGYVREGDYEVSAIQTPGTTTGTTTGTMTAGVGWMAGGLLALLFLGSMGKKNKRKK